MGVIPASMFVSCSGDFLLVTKLWGDDTLSLKFPITLRTEPIKGMKFTRSTSFLAQVNEIYMIIRTLFHGKLKVSEI